MSDLTPRILELVARLKGEASPALVAPSPDPAPVPRAPLPGRADRHPARAARADAAEPTPVVVRPGPYAFPWPDTLPGLGRRRVVAFTDCLDCVEAPAWPIRLVEVGPVLVALPGDRGTWVRYGDRPLCLPCARQRAEPAPCPTGPGSPQVRGRAQGARR